jgi:transcriptional regulator with XRE-family HTH domain/tetratricopeptide (TPR) repeat protein
VACDADRPRLREYRLQLGWTQQEMAERIAHLAWMQRREHAGVNADMVAKWERGVKGLSPRYRELLCHLFGVTPDQLGFKDATTTADARRLPPVEDESLVGMLDTAAQLLDQLGAAGTALAPHLLHAWKDTVTTRRTMLGLLDPAATDPIGHARATSATVTDLEQLADRYQALYPSADPNALLTSVAAHVRMATDALRHDPTPDQRRRLLRNLAQVAILAGHLASEDLGNAMSGRTYYSLAMDTAREAGDDQLTAIAHGYAAQLNSAEGLMTTALDHLTTAAEYALSLTPVITSWLAATEATIHADRGEHQLARDALDRARIALDKPAGHPTPAWLDEHSAEHLAAAAGHTLLRAGDHNGARNTLAMALDKLRATARRQRALLLIDLATAELHTGNLPDACARATEAAESLRQTPYAAAAARLRAFRAAAAQPLTSRALRVLDEQVRHLAA